MTGGNGGGSSAQLRNVTCGYKLANVSIRRRCSEQHFGHDKKIGGTQ